jgi:tetratricopeptide (TPR) repeat protein
MFGLFKGKKEQVPESKKNNRIQTPTKYNFNEGREAYENGCKLLDESKYEEALPLFDLAVKNGVVQAYADKVDCLQGLNYWADSITDFDIAIEEEPEDCNLYFMRGLAKNVLGDFTGALLDAELAMKYSKIDNEQNRERLETAKKSGYRSLEALCYSSTRMWEQNFKFFVERINRINGERERGNAKGLEDALYVFDRLHNQMYKAPKKRRRN